MIEATLLISIPIFLSWFTTVKKQRLKARLLRYGEEGQELESQLDELMEISRRRASDRRPAGEYGWPRLCPLPRRSLSVVGTRVSAAV